MYKKKKNIYTHIFCTSFCSFIYFFFLFFPFPFTFLYLIVFRGRTALNRANDYFNSLFFTQLFFIFFSLLSGTAFYTRKRKIGRKQRLLLLLLLLMPLLLLLFHFAYIMPEGAWEGRSVYTHPCELVHR